jgi:protoporphyrin/coproporphyrin ferrochelatase
MLAHTLELPVFTGMKNWHPFMEDTLKKIQGRGFRRGIGVVLAPHRSDASWDKYLRCVEEAKMAAGANIDYEYIHGWHDHPGFTVPYAESIKEAIKDKLKTYVIFCAHSIPVDMAAKSNYREEFKESSSLAAKEAGIFSWGTAYQSRSGSPRQPWLEPDVCTVISEIDTTRFSEVLIVPIGFLCENVEILFDLDIEAKDAAGKKGLVYRRARTIMHHPRFISLLNERILEKAGVIDG